MRDLSHHIVLAARRFTCDVPSSSVNPWRHAYWSADVLPCMSF